MVTSVETKIESKNQELDSSPKTDRLLVKLLSVKI